LTEKAADLVEEMWLEALERRGTATMLVVGDSMRPYILRGDRVVVSAVPDADGVRAGDVVLLRIEKALVVHRILRRIGAGRKLRFRQKGDATLESSVVGSDAVLAKVVRIEHQDGDARPVEPGWSSERLLLWAAVCTTDLLYRSGHLVKRKLRALPGVRPGGRLSGSIKRSMRRAQERFVEQLSSKVRPT